MRVLSGIGGFQVMTSRRTTTRRNSKERVRLPDGPRSAARGAKVTVVITSYNPGPYLKEAIESVMKQSYTNWRMIIVDDASTDNSLQSVRNYLDDTRITLLVNRRNLGQTKSLNVALKQVSTPYLVQLDSDDWFVPDTLQVLIREAQRSPANVALVSGNIKLVWKDESGRDVKTLIRLGGKYRDKYDFMLANRSCWPRFYRTSALRAVGGWPTNGPYEGRYIEDLRILYRLAERYRFRWINRTLYMHRRHQKNMTRKVREMKNTLYWLIDDTLKRWGGQYKPKYRLLPNGYPQIASLIPTVNRSIGKRAIARTKMRTGTARKRVQARSIASNR